MRARGLFRSSTVEINNEIVQVGTNNNTEVSLQSLSTNTDLSNFQVRQSRSEIVEDEAIETVEDVTNPEITQVSDSETKQNQKITTETSETSNEQNEKNNAKHSSETNVVEV